MESRTANRWTAHRGVESVWNERVCRSFADSDAFSSLGFLYTKQYHPSGNVLARWEVVLELKGVHAHAAGNALAKDELFP